MSTVSTRPDIFTQTKSILTLKSTGVKEDSAAGFNLLFLILDNFVPPFYPLLSFLFSDVSKVLV